MKSEHKKKYDSVLMAVTNALKKGNVSNFKVLRERMAEFPTIKAKYGPQMDALEAEVNKDMQAPQSDYASPLDMNASPPRFASPLDMQWKSPNGDPFDNLYQKQQKSK